jgi:hypothetical protein
MSASRDQSGVASDAEIAARLDGAASPLGAGDRVRRPGIRPGVGDILDVDREYRERAAAGDLPKITPRLWNPEQVRWLPVLHATRGGWNYTALFSNTPTAHRLGRTADCRRCAHSTRVRRNLRADQERALRDGDAAPRLAS